MDDVLRLPQRRRANCRLINLSRSLIPPNRRVTARQSGKTTLATTRPSLPYIVDKIPVHKVLDYMRCYALRLSLHIYRSLAAWRLTASVRNAQTRFSYTTNVVHVPGNILNALVPRPL